MTRYERRTDQIEQAIQAGRKPPHAGRITKALIDAGATDAAVEVWANGLVVVETKASSQKVTGVLNAIPYEDLDPDEPSAEDRANRAVHAKAEAALVAGLEALRSQDTKTPEAKTILALCRWLGIVIPPGQGEIVLRLELALLTAPGE